MVILAQLGKAYRREGMQKDIQKGAQNSARDPNPNPNLNPSACGVDVYFIVIVSCADLRGHVQGCAR